MACDFVAFSLFAVHFQKQCYCFIIISNVKSQTVPQDIIGGLSSRSHICEGSTYVHGTLTEWALLQENAPSIKCHEHRMCSVLLMQVTNVHSLASCVPYFTGRTISLLEMMWKGHASCAKALRVHQSMQGTLDYKYNCSIWNMDFLIATRIFAVQWVLPWIIVFYSFISFLSHHFPKEYPSDPKSSRCARSVWESN